MSGEGGGGSLRTRTVRNLGVVLAFRILTLAYQVVKARFLDHVSVGIVACGETLIGFVQTFADQGVERAAVQVEGDDRKVLNTALCLRVAFSVPCYAILWFVAPIWGSWQGGASAAEVTWVVRLIGLNLLIGVVSIVPSAQFNRHLLFGRVETAQFAAILLSSGLGIYLLSVHEMGYRAVAISAVAQVGTYTLLVSAMNPSHFGRGWDREVARRLLGYGKYVFAGSVLIYLINYVDNVIISSERGVAELGVYAMAFTWGNRVVLDFTHVASKVMFPTLSRLQSDPSRFRGAYLNALRFGAFLVCPLALGMAAVSETFVPCVLGTHWDPGVTRLLPVLCMYGCLRSFASIHGDALAASGRPRLVTLTSALFLALVVPSGVLAARAYGAMGLACVFLSVSFLANLFSIGLVRRALAADLGEIAGWIVRPLIAAGLMAGAVWGVSWAWPGRGWAELVALVCAGAVLYPLASLLLQRSTLTGAWGLLRETLRGGAPSVDARPEA